MYHFGKIKLAYSVYKYYLISPGNLNDFLQEEYNLFLRLYGSHLNDKKSPQYKNLINTQSSFETALKTNKVNILITRSNPVLFKMLSLEQNIDYLFEILIKYNYIRFHNKEYIQKPIKDILIKLKQYNFLIKSENKTFNQFSKDLYSKIYFIS